MNDNQNIESCSIVFSSAIEDVVEVNSSFDRGIMRIAYHGANRNKMFIDKHAFEAAIPSMYNCPVVCNYIRDTDSIGSHDVDVIKRDGNIKMVNITTPVGVVPESARTWWREVVEDDGSVNEYLCTDILIWKRQEAYEHIRDNGITDESMEIRVKSGRKKDDGLYHVDSFEFLAFCLLESAPPCFESAGIELFTLSEFKTKYAIMMEDFKKEFSGVMTVFTDDIQHNLSKGGMDELDVNELMQKYGLADEDIDFDMTNMEQSEIETRFAQIQAQKASAQAENGEQQFADGGEGADGHEDATEATAETDTGDADPAPVSEPEQTAQTQGSEQEVAGDDDAGDDDDDGAPANRTSHEFSLTAEQFMQEMLEAMSTEIYADPVWGDVRRYWYVDHDCSACEVYAYDVSDDKLYGFAYSMNGDHVMIDFACKKRKKFAFVDFDEGDSVFSVRNIVSEFRSKFEQRRAAEQDVFDRFTDLNGNEMFEDLRSNCSNMPIEHIEEKCFAIRGRNAHVASFSLDGAQKVTRIPIERQSASKMDEPYGGIFAKYNVGTR